MTASLVYAGYPFAYLHEAPSPDSRLLRQLLWGDTLVLQEDGEKAGFVRVSCRGDEGFVPADSVQRDALLDLIFLDVGQGDSAVMVTPRGQRVLVDFGQDDHTFRYLRWRYRDLDHVPFAAALISHGDEDHYRGLTAFCRGRDPAEDKFTFATLYHNGLLDDGCKESEGGQSFYGGLVTNRAEFERACQEGRGAGRLRDALSAALACGRIGDLRSLSADVGTLPGLMPKHDLQVEVLGPLVEPDARGRPRLRCLGSFSLTKNGHSLILRVTYGAVRILLGGDLNSPAEELLLSHYGEGLSGEAQLEAVRRRLGADIVKSFHHGSGDFRERFLQALRPVATIISSGDNESYSHPRADALGAIGRWSRGPRPLIFSTELARSTLELSEHPRVLRRGLKEDAPPEQQRRVDSAVARYGAINLRTDGQRLILAQRVEKNATSGKRPKEWDAYLLEQKGGEWALRSPPAGPR